MALTGPSSYLPTTNEFLAHWQLVNAALGAAPLTLAQASITRATLETLRNQLTAARALVQQRLNEVSLAAGDIATLRASLLVRFEQFTGRIRANAPGSKWAESLPLMPSPGAGLSKFHDAVTDVLHLWDAFEQAESEVVLPDNFTLAGFQTLVNDLTAASSAHSLTEKQVQLARGDRNALQEKIRAILRDYRDAVPSHLMPGNPLLESLPRLSPLRGHTPEPVQAEGTWVEATTEAKIVWSASADEELKKYEVRWSPGNEAEDYSADDEEVLGSVPPSELREFFTTQGLLLPGGTSLFRVYVILTTDNERGSNTVLVARPGGG